MSTPLAHMSLLSPRSFGPSSAGLHRPWEQAANGSPSSTVFPFPSPVSQSAPATPSGLTHIGSGIFANHHGHYLLHPALFAATPSSPFIPPQPGNSGGDNGPLSPLQNSIGSPYSNYSWPSPFAVPSFVPPLPSMPFTPTMTSAGPSGTSSANQSQISPPKVASPRNAPQNSNGNMTIKTEPGLPSTSQQQHQSQPAKSCPPKKKLKPPPISIDSSISNYSANLNPMGGMMSMSAGLINMSPTFGSAMASPLMSAPFTAPYSDLSAFGYRMFDGPLTPAIASSGYGSMDGHLYSPLTFAYLCFFPGTKLKIMYADDHPNKIDWQPVEVVRENNKSLNVGQRLKLIQTVKGDIDHGSCVEFTFAAVDADLAENFTIHIKALCSAAHPFYDPLRGWVSLEPNATRDVYGITCQQLKHSDIVSAHPPDRIEVPNSANDHQHLFGDWSRRAFSMESLQFDPRMAWTTMPQLHTPRESKPRIKKEKKEKKDDRAKRPMNAFMLFAKEWRVAYTNQFPGRDNRAISCMLGEHWKGLTTDERQKYTEKAKTLAEQYKESNPDCWKRRSRSRSDSDAQLIVVDEPSNGRVSQPHSPEDLSMGSSRDAFHANGTPSHHMEIVSSVKRELDEDSN